MAKESSRKQHESSVFVRVKEQSSFTKSGLENLLKNLEEKGEVKAAGKTSGPFGSKIEYKYRARTLNLKTKKRRQKTW